MQDQDSARGLDRLWGGLEPQIEMVPMPALGVDRAGVVVRATRGLGPWTAEELVGASLEERMDESRRDAVRDALASVWRGVASVLELPLANAAGWVELSMSPLRAGDSIVGALVLAQEVSARKLEEARLRHRERLLVDTQGVAHLGVWEWDVREPTASWSEELYKIYGLDPATHVPSYEDYLTRVHEDDRDRVREATDAVFVHHAPYAHDERIYRPDGEMRFLHTWAEPILEDGKLARLIGVCQDITDRKLAEQKLEESEARLRAIFERSPIGIATVDRDGRVTDANPALRSMLEPFDLGTAFADMLHQGDADRLEHYLAGLFSGDAQPVQLRLRGADGDLFARVTGATVDATGGRAAFAILIVEDVSIHKKAEEADRVSFSRLLRIQELEAVSEWKSTLLQVASHEIRNPLSPMILLLDGLRVGRYGALTDSQAETVGLVAQQAERISHLIRDIVDVALIEQGRLSVAPRTVEIEPIVRRVADTFRPLAGRWGVALGHDLGERLTARVDPDRLEQVVINLLSNALKFTPEGGQVDVAAVRRSSEIVISVRDSGPGLDEEAQSRLFRAFTEPSAPRHGAPAGSGLGLFISKSLVEAHGGRLWVESRLGAGATFLFTVPNAPD